MALVLRLTALSYAVAHAEARWFQMGADVGDWVPATPTTEPTASSPELWESKTTAAPHRRPVDWELRRRDENTSTICGYSLNNLAGPPVTCGRGEYCLLSTDYSLVGCCTATNSRDCVIPTACLDSSRSAELSNGDTPFTTYCGNSNRPYCVTHTYDANFFDLLHGASFVGCAARAASGIIVGSSVMGDDTSSTMALSTFTTTNGATTATVTVLLPSNSATETGGPNNIGGSSNSRNVGAIAGGVVGGVAGLALLIGAIVFFIRRRKKRPQNPDALGYGSKMPPSDQDMYRNEQIPGSQYPSSFFGEAPPGMMQASEQPATAYPPNAYGIQHSNSIYTAGNNHNVEAPAYQPQYQPQYQHQSQHQPQHQPQHQFLHQHQHQHQRAVPSKHHDGGVSPLEESPVSPVSPAENYNTMVSALSNQSPPLQPLQPAVHRPQSEYAPYSPPPPEQYQSYRPYPGT